MALTKGDRLVIADYSGTCGVCQSPISAWALDLQYIGPAETPGSKEFFILRPIQCPNCFNMLGHVVLHNVDFMDHLPQQMAKWN